MDDEFDPTELRRAHRLALDRRRHRDRRSRLVRRASYATAGLLLFTVGYATRAAVDARRTPSDARMGGALVREAANDQPVSEPAILPPAPTPPTSPAPPVERALPPPPVRPGEPAGSPRTTTAPLELPPRAARIGEPRETDADASRTRAALIVALSGWLTSARTRDVDRHMTFYPPTVTRFFLEQGVSRATVRAEKERVFGQAEAVELQASEPTITIAPDGRRAVMRFRKQYVIAGPGVDRSGEVLQELVWIRTPAGWQIDSERDLAVLRSR